MNTKKQFTISEITPNSLIEKGMFVKLIDGSSLTNEGGTQDYYIVFSYEEETKDKRKLKDIPCQVLETNIKNKFATSVVNTLYQQDLKIKVGELIMYTSSSMVIPYCEK